MAGRRRTPTPTEAARARGAVVAYDSANGVMSGFDIADGSIRARVAVDSPAQSVAFGAPGRDRDFYLVSLSTVARVEFTD